MTYQRNNECKPSPRTTETRRWWLVRLLDVACAGKRTSLNRCCRLCSWSELSFSHLRLVKLQGIKQMIHFTVVATFIPRNPKFAYIYGQRAGTVPYSLDKSVSDVECELCIIHCQNNDTLTIHLLTFTVCMYDEK